MKEAKISPANKDEATPLEQHQEVNHTERIKSQVLATIGKPPRLDRVEVSRHHGSKYRVNIWQQPESDKNVAVTVSPRIGLSYYLTVSDTGDIIDSNPPLTKLCSSA
jgi:hypothetical protein